MLIEYPVVDAGTPLYASHASLPAHPVKVQGDDLRNPIYVSPAMPKLAGMVSLSLVSKVASQPAPLMLHLADAADRVTAEVKSAKHPKDVLDFTNTVYPGPQYRAVGFTVGTDVG